MPLRLRPAKDRVENMASDLKESAETSRFFAALFMGSTVVNGVGVYINTAAERPGIVTVNLAASALSAAITLHRSLKSNAYSQQAAALEGALAQHELAATPYQLDQPSYFVQSDIQDE